MKECW